MSISDLLIIYLTCGAPVAAERLLSANGAVRLKDVVSAFCYLIVWPTVALSLIKREVEKRFVSNAYSSGIKISDSAAPAESSEQIRRIAAILAAAGTGRSAVQIAELLHRCAGLHEIATNDGSGRPPIVELLKAVDHSSIAISVACHRRKNAAKVLAHLDGARRALDELLRNASLAHLPPEAQRELAAFARSVGHSAVAEGEPTHAVRSIEAAA